MLRRALARPAVAYDRLNTAWPLTTKSVTCSVLLGAGDACCQAAQVRSGDGGRGGTSSDGFDLHRVARMAGWGLAVNGPTGHLWYRAVERLVGVAGPRGVALKVASDQLLYTPPLTGLFFVWQHALSGASLSDACAASREATWPTLQVNWCYWSVVHVATFTVVPVEYRVLFVSLKNFLWGGFLSLVSNREAAAAEL